MVKLAHDGCLAQKVLPLPFRVASFEGLDGHGHIQLPRNPQSPIADFPRLPWGPSRAGDRSWWEPLLLKQGLSHASSLTHLYASQALHARLRVPLSLCSRCPSTHTPHSTVPTACPLRLTRADDLLNMNPGGFDLSGHTAACPAWLLIVVRFCTELGLWDLPWGVM